MHESNESDEVAFEKRLAFHRRQIDELTPSTFNDPRFDEAKQRVVDLLEGRKTDIASITEPSAVHTNAQELYTKMETPSGEYKMKPGVEMHDPALKGVKWVSVLRADENDVQLSISEDGKMPRTLTMSTDYFRGAFEKTIAH